MKSRIDPKAMAQAASICASFNLRKATRAVTQYFDLHLQGSGLRSTQFVILVVTAARGRASMAELSDALVMDRTTLTRSLRPLFRRKWLRFIPGEDRRQKTVVLAGAGERKLLAAVPLWKKAQDRIESGFGAARWGRFLGDLNLAIYLSLPPK